MDREEAQRMAVNFLIQSLAAEITHTALVRCLRWLKAHNLKTRPIAEVHDALYFESPEDEIDKALPAIRKLMESPPVPLKVDLKTDWKISRRWENTDSSPAIKGFEEPEYKQKEVAA